MNIEKAIKQASKFLQQNCISSFILDSELLMSKALQKERKYLIMNIKEEIKEKN